MTHSDSRPSSFTRESLSIAALVLAALLTGGCEIGEDEEGEHGEGVVDVDTAQCQSGARWEGGDEESPLMHPGMDCVGCHQREDEGPIFALAGTVYEDLSAVDDCLGVGGVTVEITDADNVVHVANSNSAGNFWLDRGVAIALPYRARVGRDGNWLEMATPQTETRCATCHTSSGASGAAGRIIAP